MRRSIPLAVIIAGSLLGLLAMSPGLDYFGDSGSIDALARWDLRAFFAEQPLMGSFSLLVRAPFAALVYHADLSTVYYAGALPCVAALGWLAARLVRAMRAAGRSREDRLLVALLCLGSIAMVRALHWGHPEEVLATALAVGGMLAAAGERPVLAGVLVGVAFATKQWAVLVGLPALLVLAEGRGRFVVAAAGAGAALMVPMLIGDPHQFLLVQKAAGSIDPAFVMNRRPEAPGTHTNPFDIWLPFASRESFDGQRLLFMEGPLARLAHPLVLAVGVLLPALAWRRRRRLSAVAGLKLLALILLLRCALDPMSLEYYHLPFVVTAAAAGALGGRRELDFALLSTAGLTLAFAHTAVGVADLERFAAVKFLVYMAVAVPAAAWLACEVYGTPRAARAFAARLAGRWPRAQAA